MTDTTIYFGRPGALLSLVGHPVGGVDSTRLRETSRFKLGSGGSRVSKLMNGKRQYKVSWESLEYATFALLEAFDQGHQGPGPFVFLDPGRRNLLTVNQSSATSESNDTSNFTVAGTGGSISSDSTFTVRTSTLHPRSLKWSFSITNPSSATLSLDAPSADWSGIPVAIRSHTFSFWAKGSGSDAIVTLTPKLTWLDSTGATISTSSGSDIVTSSSSWTQGVVTATAPATTAFVNCSVAASGASISNGSILNFVEFMLNEGSSADSTWTPGTGVLPVQVMSLFEGWPCGWPGYREKSELVLQEVGV